MSLNRNFLNWIERGKGEIEREAWAGGKASRQANLKLG
jgi:hypothetical protein